MKRSLRVRRSWVAAMGLAALMCACSMRHERPAPGPVHHIVVCWLKEPGSAEARSRLIEASRSLTPKFGDTILDSGRPSLELKKSRG